MACDLGQCVCVAVALAVDGTVDVLSDVVLSPFEGLLVTVGTTTSVGIPTVAEEIKLAELLQQSVSSEESQQHTMFGPHTMTSQYWAEVPGVQLGMAAD